MKNVFAAVTATVTMLSAGVAASASTQGPTWGATPYASHLNANLEVADPVLGLPDRVVLTPMIAATVDNPATRCADVFENSVSDATRAILWDCSAKLNQQWARVVPVLTPDQKVTVMFVNQNSSRCLDVEHNSAANGAAIIQWTCHGGWNQLWEMAEPGAEGPPAAPAGDYQLKNRRTGKCLDVSGGVNANGAALIQWDCKKADDQNINNQIWNTIPAAPPAPA